MRKLMRILMLLIIFVMAAAAAGAAGEESGFKFSGELGFDDDMVYVVPDGVPEYVNCVNALFGVYITSPFFESPHSITVEPLKNDPDDQNVLEIEDSISSDPSLFFQPLTPGKSSFHLHAEGQLARADQDLTFTALDWQEDPVFVLREGDSIPTFTVEAGGTLQLKELFDAVAEDLTDQVFAKYGLPVNAENNNFIYFAADDPETDEPAFQESDPGTLIPLKSGDIRIWIQRNGWANFGLNVNLHVFGEEIFGPERIEPGQTVRFTAGTEKEPSRDCTWSIAGTGASVNPQTGEVSVSKDAQESSWLVLTAVMTESGKKLQKEITVAAEVFRDENLTMAEMAEGFTVPLYAGGEKYTTQWNRKTEVNTFSDAKDLPWAVRMSYMLQARGSMRSNDLEKEYDVWIRMIAEALSENYGTRLNTVLQMNIEEILLEDQYPARAVIYQNQYLTGACLVYSRDNQMLIAEVAVIRNTAPLSQTPVVDLHTIRALAERIIYDPDKASVTKADLELTLTVPQNKKWLMAGEKLQVKATYANPGRAKKVVSRDDLNWSNVTHGGENWDRSLVSISDTGLITTSASISEPIPYHVSVWSLFSGTGLDDYDLTILPRINKFSLSSSSAVFYSGSEETLRVTPVFDPECIPCECVTWKMGKEGIVSMTVLEDGSVSFSPLKTGKTTVTATAPDGKKCTLSVNVMEPVTSVTLSAKGKAQPGKTVTVSAQLEPKNAGNKKVEWSVDTQDEIAVIDKNGKLKIGKDVPSGTVITVTCLAQGAPEKLEESMEITVE